MKSCAKTIDRPPVDPPGAGHHAVARHPLLVHAEVAARVDDEPVELLEGPLVEQRRDALAGGLLAGLVLAGDPLGPAAELGRRAEPGQLGEPLLEGQPALRAGGGWDSATR